MLPGSEFFQLRSLRDLTFTVSPRLLVLIFILFLTAPPAIAGYSWTTSWVSDSAVPSTPRDGNDYFYYEEEEVRAGPLYYAAGITEQDYNSYGHNAGVNTFITSPNGRSASMGAYGMTYARAETYLLWDPNETGEMRSNSDHYGYCPHYGGSSFPPSTGPIMFPIHGSVNVMHVISPGGNAYRPIVPCDVRCKVHGYIRPNYAGQYVWLLVPEGPLGCLRGSIVRRNARLTPCFDI